MNYEWRKLAVYSNRLKKRISIARLDRRIQLSITYFKKVELVPFLNKKNIFPWKFSSISQSLLYFTLRKKTRIDEFAMNKNSLYISFWKHQDLSFINWQKQVSYLCKLDAIKSFNIYRETKSHRQQIVRKWNLNCSFDLLNFRPIIIKRPMQMMTQWSSPHRSHV